MGDARTPEDRSHRLPLADCPLHRVAKILVIEDDSKTANAICNGLRTEGYEAAVARTGEEGDDRLLGRASDQTLRNIQ